MQNYFLNLKMRKNYYKTRKQSGAAAIITVVIIGAVSLVIAKSLAMMSLGGINRLQITEKSEQVMSLADGCAEEALRRLQIDNNYEAGHVLVTIDNGTCDISVDSDINVHEISVSASTGEYYKNIKLIANIKENNSIEILSWEESVD
jgi:predicted dinucleotide-utilizing enzyme